MPTVGDLCSNCAEGSYVSCDAGVCMTCPECGAHDNDDAAFWDGEPDIPFEGPENAEQHWYNRARRNLLPAGWTWYAVPDNTDVAQIIYSGISGQPLNEEAINAWASENELLVAPHEHPFIRYLTQASNTHILCEYEGCEAQAIGRLFCDDHGVIESCTRCPSYSEHALDVESSYLVDAEGNPYCEGCSQSLCPSCNRFSRQGRTYSRDSDLYVCRRCFLGADEAESFDDNADLRNRELVIPVIPGRENIRTCGVEIEGGNGTGNGDDLARALFEQDLSNLDEMGGYHHGHDGFAHVERDSSVDWETVIGPLNPAVQADVTRLNQVMRIIRGMVKAGTLTLDLRAGCHIHVEAAGTSLDGAFNLNTLFAYAEDVIFRLGAARWPIHRAISDSHYTQPIPKENRKIQFARAHAEGDEARYYALSFTNYFSQMLNRCRCGATRYDSWEDCTCDLGKCTFEFRVFNTTANPRKLHAYLALTQALVAKAMVMEKVENPVAEFPAHAFVSHRFKDMSEIEQEEIVEEWRERLTWLFRELPLTDEEKESLGYCIRHSELEAVGEEFITELLPEQQVTEEVTA